MVRSFRHHQHDGACLRPPSSRTSASPGACASSSVDSGTHPQTTYSAATPASASKSSSGPSRENTPAGAAAPEEPRETDAWPTALRSASADSLGSTGPAPREDDEVLADERGRRAGERARARRGVEAAEEVSAYGKEFAAARKALGDTKIGKYPGQLPLEIPQVSVKRYIPPESSVWRGNVRSEWWGHMPPYRRVCKKCKKMLTQQEPTLIEKLKHVRGVKFFRFSS